ncbi:MAG TPA: alpha-ketoacid dehydrogenase subunit beta, partial [Actinomycetales bacterium]|nr:alpha-ketoacid dehydrogenase subunit beta [Actinomycetales bacterium]
MTTTEQRNQHTQPGQDTQRNEHTQRNENTPHEQHTQTLPLAGAVTAGLAAAMERDESVILMGEDIGQLGGVFRVTQGLKDRFGADRVRDTPLAESGIVGTAIGMALAGYRPVVEIQFDGFVFPAFDQITTQLAKLRYRSHGDVAVPVVIRIPYGGDIGAIEHHSESPEAYFAHTAGLRVVTPATAADAYVLIQQAITCPDPVIFLEPKSRYWNKGEVDLAPDAVDLSPAGIVRGLESARVVRRGGDVTLVGYGPTVATLLSAAEAAAEDGVECEVIDLRSISPLDVPTVVASVRRTGRLVVAHEAPTHFGPGAELAARIQEECFYSLEAPVQRVGGFHTPYPANAHEHAYLPGLDRV